MDSAEVTNIIRNHRATSLRFSPYPLINRLQCNSIDFVPLATPTGGNSGSDSAAKRANGQHETRHQRINEVVRLRTHHLQDAAATVGGTYARSGVAPPTTTTTTTKRQIY